jgi:hypothetical protein
MNCHPLIILIILNFKREPTSKSSLEIDSTNKIKFRTSSIGEEVSTLLENHPVYFTQIKKTIGYTLNNEELILIYWAKKNRSCGFIQNNYN